MNNNFDEVIENSKKEMKNYSNKIKEEFKEFDDRLNHSRKLSISAISKLILLSSSIVGFSVSLFSIPAFQSRLDLGNLRFAWYFFIAVIVLGFFYFNF